MTETKRIVARDAAAGIKTNSLLFRPQLKAHNSMLKVIENNCKSNSPSILLENRFSAEAKHKTNVTAWPCRCPHRSIKNATFSRERAACSEQLRCVVIFHCYVLPSSSPFNQIKSPVDGRAREISSFSMALLYCNLQRGKLNLTSFVCYDYLAVNGRAVAIFFQFVRCFTRLPSQLNALRCIVKN